jgi:hypothetical protein
VCSEAGAPPGGCGAGGAGEGRRMGPCWGAEPRAGCWDLCCDKKLLAARCCLAAIHSSWRSWLTPPRMRYDSCWRPCGVRLRCRMWSSSSSRGEASGGDGNRAFSSRHGQRWRQCAGCSTCHRGSSLQRAVMPALGGTSGVFLQGRWRRLRWVQGAAPPGPRRSFRRREAAARLPKAARLAVTVLWVWWHPPRRRVQPPRRVRPDPTPLQLRLLQCRWWHCRGCYRSPAVRRRR